MSEFTHTSDLQHVRWEVGAGQHVHTVAILLVVISWAAAATSPAAAQADDGEEEDERREDERDTGEGNDQVDVCGVEQRRWLPAVIEIWQCLGQGVSQQDAHSHGGGERRIPVVPHHHDHLVLEEVGGAHGARGAQLASVR